MARRVFFSFHYVPDVWRAWNVRNCWVVKPTEEVADGFFDASVFEASKKEGDENLKQFLREGLKNSSVTCVLTGENTWTRRWVRYEIVRSVLKGNGLLAVDIDGVKNKDEKIGVKGANPLDAVGVYLQDGSVYFAEWTNGRWTKYADYTASIPTGALWFPAPTNGNVMTLSRYCSRYDFAKDSGREKLSKWIEASAKSAGK